MRSDVALCIHGSRIAAGVNGNRRNRNYARASSIRLKQIATFRIARGRPRLR